MSTEFPVYDVGEDFYNRVMFDKLFAHKDHDIEIATYGHPEANVAIECLDCGSVLIDFAKF